ncbi:uncharacterized protein TRIADDRAFT_57796 [Trichoplax adhaerens]|uniref:Uncharacterized protein n=1 Tax=Trichoplax adhaerens TaxID=10228 RepID=B3S1E0_TRIAD|nr:predicted protein [Trichoplax adhaerens]EDV23311.1 predicted protein [Trichoplax adhaerens]|eukprot:XP_002114221.1 predicted protein [Trichoplax adhaerens]
MDDDTKSEDKKNENDVEEQMQASTEDNVQSTDEKKEDSFMDGLAKRLANMHTDAKSASPVAWSKSNMAEVFFSRMKEKDGISYSAMILGTLKVGTTAAYNALLQSIVYEIIPPKRWISAEQLVHHMQDEPAVSPDLGKNIYNIAKIGSPFEPIKDEEPSLAVFDNMLKACRVNFMNTIVQVAVKLDDADLAVRIFKLADDNWQFVKSDRDFLSSFLAIICSNVEPELVWNCYSAIVPKSLNICRQVATECFQATQRTANPATLSSFMLGELIRLNVVCGHLDEAWKLAKERTNFKVQLNFTALQALFVGSVAASDAPATKKICRSIFAAGYYLPDTMLDKVQQSVNFDNADLKNIKSLFNLSKENGGNDFTLGLQ